MRIPFYLKQPNLESNLLRMIDRYDIVQQTYPSLAMSFDSKRLNDIQSYTDDARYELDVFEINFSRCYNSQSIAMQNDELIKNGKIQVFAIKFNFNCDISFKLFQSNWTDYWHQYKKDLNIQTIKPIVDLYSVKDLGYFIFKSLFTSYIMKILDIINPEHVMCVKQKDMLIFAYGVESNYVFNNRNTILDLFLDAIYEMVSVTSGRGYYDVPEQKVYKEIDILKAYDLQRNKPSNKQKKKNYIVEDYNKFI